MAVTPLPRLADPRMRGDTRPPGERAPAPRADTRPPSERGGITLAQVRSLLDANNALTKAQQDVATQAETGSTASRRRAQVALLKAQEAVKGNRAPAPTATTDPKKKTANATEPFKSPVVTVPELTGAGGAGAGIPTAPIAVTDPQSQISPEEQAARERARLLLMNYGGRAGRVSGASTGTLGFRTLMGA